MRQDIFIREQQCFFHDIDFKDQQAKHLLGIKENNLVAYVRFLPKGIAYLNDASFGRIVTHSSVRGTGLGKMMMQKILDYIEQQYPNDSLLMMAEHYLQKFYESFGFITTSEPFQELGIMNVYMRRKALKLVENYTNAAS